MESSSASIGEFRVSYPPLSCNSTRLLPSSRSLPGVLYVPKLSVSLDPTGPRSGHLRFWVCKATGSLVLIFFTFGSLSLLHPHSLGLASSRSILTYTTYSLENARIQRSNDVGSFQSYMITSRCSSYQQYPRTPEGEDYALLRRMVRISPCPREKSTSHTLRFF